MNNLLKVGLIIVGVFVGLALLFVGIAFFILADAITSTGKVEEETISGSGDKVAVVEIRDVIISSENIIRQLKKYQKNSTVKSIVIRIESPGGGIAPAQEIYEEIKNITKSGKPTVVSMGSVAASGGYYIALGASKIVANPGTLTGSIGVVLQYPNIRSLFNKIGIDMVTYKSGKMKDAGSPYRNPNMEETKYFQDLIDNSFDQFIEAVINERHLPRNKVLEIADGRAFTGVQAYELKLIDTLGTYEDAIRIAARMGGIAGEPKIIKERKKETFLEKFATKMFSSPLDKIQELFDEPILEYKFTN